MNKITKRQLQQSVDLLNKENSSQHNYLMRIKRALKSIDIDILSDEFDEPKSQLKQLDQSVFDGLDEKWRFAAVDQNAETNLFEEKPVISNCGNYWVNASGAFKRSVLHFDASDWQNSLIEREKKELLEVDLSSELTGSELCKAMLERGDRFVMCMAGDGTDVIYDLACFVSSTHPYIGRLDNYRAVTPINNQGEPLTASEVGL